MMNELSLSLVIALTKQAWTRLATACEESCLTIIMGISCVLAHCAQPRLEKLYRVTHNVTHI